MYPDHLDFALLLSLCVCLCAGMAVKEDPPEVVCVPGGDCILQCTAEAKDGVQYRAVRWYKVRDPPAPRLSGLLTRDLPNGTTRWYAGVEREVELLGESRSILLPNVTCGDSGVYMCHLAAPVGEQNREGPVLLALTDCPDSATDEVMRDTYLVIFATVVLILALVIFLISYASLKNLVRERQQKTQKRLYWTHRLSRLKRKI